MHNVTKASLCRRMKPTFVLSIRAEDMMKRTSGHGLTWERFQSRSPHLDRDLPAMAAQSHMLYRPGIAWNIASSYFADANGIKWMWHRMQIMASGVVVAGRPCPLKQSIFWVIHLQGWKGGRWPTSLDEILIWQSHLFQLNCYFQQRICPAYEQCAFRSVEHSCKAFDRA